MPPPESVAELPEIVQLVRIATPWVRMPPPSLAVLPESVQLARFRLSLLQMPPPPTAELPESVQFVRVKSARLRMPPPWGEVGKFEALPLAIVIPLRLMAKLSVKSTRLAPLPETVNCDGPG